MKVALWGIGNHAKKNLIPALYEAKNIEFIGVYSRNKESISEVLSQYGCLTWANEVEMLSDKNIDTVLLSTPPGLHFIQGKQVLDAGKNFISEKPITTNYKETKSLIRIAKEKKLLIFEAFMFLYHPHFAELKKIIELAKDDLETVNITFHLPELVEPGFRFKQKLGGSCLYDVGSYTVLTALEFFKKDKITLINSDIDIDPETNTDSSGRAYLHINDDIQCNLKWSYNSEYINELRIETSESTYITEKVFSKNHDFQPSIFIKNKNGDIVEQTVEARNHFVSMLESFSENSSSKKNADSEFERIESLASMLDKIRVDKVNF